MLLNYFWLSLWGTCRLPSISSSSPHQNRIMLTLHTLQCISLQLQKSFAKPATIMACTSTAWPKLWKGLSGYACHMFTVTKRTYCRTDSRTNSHVKTSQQSKNYFTCVFVCVCVHVSVCVLRVSTSLAAFCTSDTNLMTNASSLSSPLKTAAPWRQYGNRRENSQLLPLFFLRNANLSRKYQTTGWNNSHFRVFPGFDPRISTAGKFCA